MVNVTFLPQRVTVQVPKGSTLLDAYRSTSLPLFPECAEWGTCGRCRVRLIHHAFPPSSGDLRLLASSDLEAGYRLACFFHVKEDTQVEVAFLDVGPTYKCLDVFQEVTVELRPSVYSRREGDQELIFFDDELLQVRQALDDPLMGIVLDIGTTTLAAYLVDLKTGVQKAALSTRNPQVAYGLDGFSRICYTRSSSKGLCRLQLLCLSAVWRLILQLTRLGGCALEDIFHLVVVGNPVMLHFLLGIDPIEVSPFKPSFTEGKIFPLKDLPLKGLLDEARLETLPLISGNLGADVVATALFLDMERRKDTCLVVDIGTDAKVLLCHQGRLLACSVAAGPAFEGGRVCCGIRAQPGAISRFFYNSERGSLEYQVLGENKPRGISGSGLISLLALLVDVGILLPSGRFHKDTGSLLASRLRDTRDGPELVVASNEGKEILLSQRDVQELQAAKATIAAGVERLLEYAGLSPHQLDRIYLCGAFGTSLDPCAAVRIGLLVPIDLERIVCIGNTAGVGARMVLCHRNFRKTVASIARSVEYLELSSDPRFNDLFVQHLPFPS
ncbi:MAG TPA: ASKHA domain-containing protein [Candidatus Limnocylindrales bacterium]|nr:ASKHA domain-containing protein [Candidatus Limnocylindrales bacterium]